jgi:pyrroline-5-carboxylate reductase
MSATYTLGVIGVGNMGAALVRGVLSTGVLTSGQITIADQDGQRAAALAKELGVHLAAGNTEVAAGSEYLVLAVKPDQIPGLVNEIAGALTPSHTLVSIAAGVPISALRKLLKGATPGIVRVMPNTPVRVGAGAIAVAAAPEVSGERLAGLTSILGAVGEVLPVAEGMMDAVTGLSGSGPAFVFVMIEALADGGVSVGLPRAVALRLAAQTVFGAAKLVVATGEHPAALKDAVASPGGTTIAGLAELERAGFRSAVLSAVRAAALRSRELSRG